MKRWTRELAGVYEDFRIGYWEWGYDSSPDKSQFSMGRIFYDWWWYYLNVWRFYITIAPWR